MTAGGLVGLDPHLAVHSLLEGTTSGTIAQGRLPAGSMIRTRVLLAARGLRCHENGTLHQPEAVPLARPLVQVGMRSLALVLRGISDRTYDRRF